jgi:uncharacterized protein (DUF342 family)
MYMNKKKLADIIQDHTGCNRDEALSLTDDITIAETKSQQINFDLRELNSRINDAKADFQLMMNELTKEREKIQERCDHMLDRGSCEICGFVSPSRAIAQESKRA